MKVFYHADLDGRCAARIVKNKFGHTEKDRDNYIEMDYNKKFPFDIIGPDEKVYIVDFSLKPHEMMRLLKLTSNVVWIDHHQNIISQYNNFPYDILGLRMDGTAGCELTWIYFYGEGSTPDFARFAGDRDVWKWEFEETADFCSGAELYDLNPFSDKWNILENEPEIVIEKGHDINNYKTQRNKEYLEKYGFIGEFEGHRANIINVGLVGLEVFDSLEKKEEIQIMYAFNGEEYIVSLRSETIDVSELARRYGGNGHVRASGFNVPEIPWRTLE